MLFLYAIGCILLFGLLASCWLMLFGASYVEEEPDSESAEFSTSSTEDGEEQENVQP